MQNQINVPVLLIAFNRADTTKIVFSKIRDASPRKLYVALDGPRLNNEGDQNLCKEVQDIVQNVNWPCEVFYKINKENKGAEVNVSSAISWVLQNEEYVIVIEDDIVAPTSFFRFAEDMLIKYKDDERIVTVTGSNFTPISLKNGEDYFFAKYGHSWGWGTWKRVWETFDLNIVIQDEHLTSDFLKQICNSKAEVNYYRKLFRNMKKKGPGNNTWDAIGLYILRCYNLNAFSVIPRVNLTSNIGTYGLHAQGATEHHFRPFDESFRVEKFPDKIECFTEYDKHHFNTYITKKSPFYKRVLRKLKKIIPWKKIS